MKNKIQILLICLTSFLSHSQNTEWTITSSAIKFKIKNAGFMVDGSFGNATGKIHFDAAKSYSNSIEVEVESKTINTGINKRDEHLRKDEYFGVEKFPKITLSGTTFAKQPDGSFKGYFKLTLKGVTKDVVIPFTFIEKENKAVIEGSFKINRLDHGVGGSSMITSDYVAISIKTELMKK